MSELNNRPHRILVVGCGDIAIRVLQGLASAARPQQLFLLGRDSEAVVRAANMVTLSAHQLGNEHVVTPMHARLDDSGVTAQAIARAAPDIIFAAVSRQSWHVISELPTDRFARLSAACLGPWLPVHLDPVAKLMRGVQAAGSTAIVVNAAYPDAVHPVLATAGLSPDYGIGNLANSVPALRAVGARRLGCPFAEVQVRFVAHHFVSHRISRGGDSGGAAYSLTYWRGGSDVTDAVTAEAVFGDLTTRYRRTGGRSGQMMTAASALSVLEPLVSGKPADVHLPGWLGRPGGWPIRLTDRDSQLNLPTGLTEAEAVAINQDGQRHDGIARIGADGLVEFTDESMEIMRAELGYHCKHLTLSDVDEAATELVARYRSYAGR